MAHHQVRGDPSRGRRSCGSAPPYADFLAHSFGEHAAYPCRREQHPRASTWHVEKDDGISPRSCVGAALNLALWDARSSTGSEVYRGASGGVSSAAGSRTRRAPSTYLQAAAASRLDGLVIGVQTYHAELVRLAESPSTPLPPSCGTCALAEDLQSLVDRRSARGRAAPGEPATRRPAPAPGRPRARHHRDWGPAQRHRTPCAAPSPHPRAGHLPDPPSRSTRRSVRERGADQGPAPPPVRRPALRRRRRAPAPIARAAEIRHRRRRGGNEA